MVQMSQQQKHYLKRLKRDKWLIIFLRFLILILFAAAWEGSTRIGMLDSFIFSSPSRIVRTTLEMYQDGVLFMHIGITLYETLVSFLFVILLGLLTAVILWCSEKISKVLEPYMVVLNSLPKSALAPLLIVWLGANMKTIIVAGMSVAIFGSIISLYTGFVQTDAEQLKLIKTLGGNKKDQLLKVVLPSSISLILSVMKVNIGLCLVGVIIGEFIGAREGLGYLIIYGSQVFSCVHKMIVL